MGRDKAKAIFSTYYKKKRITVTSRRKRWKFSLQLHVNFKYSDLLLELNVVLSYNARTQNNFSPQCRWLVVGKLPCREGFSIYQNSEIIKYKNDDIWLIYCCQQLQFWRPMTKPVAVGVSCRQIKLLKAFVELLRGNNCFIKRCEFFLYSKPFCNFFEYVKMTFYSLDFDFFFIYNIITHHIKAFLNEKITWKIFVIF